MASARFSEAFGYLKESEENFRFCAASLRAHLRSNQDKARTSNNGFALVYCTRRWIEAVLGQGRLREASAFADDLSRLTEEFAESQRPAAFCISPCSDECKVIYRTRSTQRSQGVA